MGVSGLMRQGKAVATWRSLQILRHMAQLFQHILRRLNQFGALANQAVAAFGQAGVDGARYGKDIFAQLQGLPCCDEGA